MAFLYNAQTHRISMPPGDTGDLYIEVEWEDQGKEAAIVFAVVDPDREKDILMKVAEVEGNTAHIRLCNHDTRDLRSGTYKWQLRLVTSPARDEEGNILADECSDDVVSVFNGDAMPDFVLERRGARV